MKKDEKQEEPYFVEVDENGCSHCGAGRTYTVIGPDGVAFGQSWESEDDASGMAEILNEAFYRGINKLTMRPKKRKKPPKKQDKLLRRAFKRDRHRERGGDG